MAKSQMKGAMRRKRCRPEAESDARNMASTKTLVGLVCQPMEREPATDSADASLNVMILDDRCH